MIIIAHDRNMVTSEAAEFEASVKGKLYTKEQLVQHLTETTVPVSIMLNGKVLTFAECAELYNRLLRELHTKKRIRN